MTNDADPEGGVLTVNPDLVTDPTNGSVTLNPDGTYTYDPDPDFVGEDTFEYEVCDEGGNCTTAVVTIEVLPENTPNTTFADDDLSVTNVNTSVSGNWEANDNDPEGDNQGMATEVTPASNGTLTLNPDGTYDYTPAPDFIGNDQYVYHCLLYTSPSPRDLSTSRMPSSA